MTILDVIEKKRNKESLTEEDINFWIDGMLSGDIKDYQVSSLLMAIVLNGMDEDEIFYLTDAMIRSGDTIDLSKINGLKVDKHSTGGVGDKVTPLIVPILATFGLKVPKMSGRGLGHTGGTADKFESIPGYRVELSLDEFIEQVNDIGCAVISQSGELARADKKLYALRDVTGTVDSLPLIASSIMSKKIAGGADKILIDIKCGNGAMMKNIHDAKKLKDQQAGEKLLAYAKNIADDNNNFKNALNRECVCLAEKQKIVMKPIEEICVLEDFLKFIFGEDGLVGSGCC